MTPYVTKMFDKILAEMPARFLTEKYYYTFNKKYGGAIIMKKSAMSKHLSERKDVKLLGRVYVAQWGAYEREWEKLS